MIAAVVLASLVAELPVLGGPDLRPSAATARSSRSLLSVAQDRRLSRAAEGIDVALQNGNIGAAIVGFQTLLQTAPDGLVDDEGTLLSVPAWAVERLRRWPELRAALRTTATIELRRLLRGRLDAESLALADVWVAVADRSLAERLIERLRDAGLLRLAERCRERWQLGGRSIVPERRQSVWPIASTERVGVSWSSPLGETASELTRELRRLGVPVRLTRSPVVSGDAVFVRRFTTLASYDTESLAVRWETPVGEPSDDRRSRLQTAAATSEAVRELLAETLFGSPAVDDVTEESPTVRVVLQPAARQSVAEGVPLSTAAVAAFDRGSGTPRWRYRPGSGGVLSPGVRIGRDVWTVIGSRDAIAAVCLDAATGKERARLVLADLSVALPELMVSRQRAVLRVAGSRVLVATNEGLVASFDPQTRSRDWLRLVPSRSRSLGQSINSPIGLVPRSTFAEPGLALVADRDGRPRQFVAVQPDWIDVVQLDVATGRLLAAEAADGVLAVQPAAGGTPWLLAAHRVRRVRLIDRDGTDADEPKAVATPVVGAALREGAVVAGRMEDETFISPIFSASGRAVQRGAGPTLRLPATLTPAPFAAAMPASVAVAGDAIFVQTLDGLSREPVAGDAGSTAMVADGVESATTDLTKRISFAEGAFGPASGIRGLAGWLDRTVDRGRHAVAVRAWMPSVPSPAAAVQAPPRWPATRPEITEGRALRQPKYQRPLVVQAAPDAEPSPVGVAVLRGGGAIAVRGPGLPTTTLHLPRSFSNRRHERRLDRAWHVGRSLVVQVGSELVGVRLERRDGIAGEPARYAAKLAWPGTVELFPAMPRELSVPLNISEVGGPTGRLEFRNGFDQPLGDVTLTPGVVVARRSGHLIGLDLATGEPLWHRFDLTTDERLFPVLDGDARPTGRIAVAADGRIRLLAAADGRELAHTPAMRTDWLAQVARPVADSPFLILQPRDGVAVEGEGRGGGRRRVTVEAFFAGPRWERTIAAGAVVAGSWRHVAIFEPSDGDGREGQLTILDAAGQTFATQTVASEEPITKLVLATLDNGSRSSGESDERDLSGDEASAASALGGMLVGIGRDAAPEVMPASQPASLGRSRPTLTGQLLYLDAAGRRRWEVDVKDIALDTTQPAGLPVVFANFAGTQYRNPQSQTSTISLWDRRTGERIFHEYRSTGIYRYHEFVADAASARFSLRLKDKTVQFDYATPPPAPDETSSERRPGDDAARSGTVD